MRDGVIACERQVPPPLDRGHALFLDFDGTLVEIAPTPDLVRVPAGLPHLLGELAARLDGAVAVVSGRPLDELILMLAPFTGTIIGQHGLECRHGDGRKNRLVARPELRRALSTLAEFAAKHDGVMLEDKGGTLALHYRRAPSLGTLCRAIVQQAADTSGEVLAAVAGKMVIELMPRSGGKGRAIIALLADAPFHGRLPVFIGDDTTDEDGFAAVNRLGGVSVHVGGGATIARHSLATVRDVLAWLARGLAQ